MKKIVLGLVLGLTILFGKTLVVDDDNPNMCEHGDCKSGFIFCLDYYDYKTIQDAVDDAQDGDTIKICKGTYNEAVNFQKNNFSSFKFIGASDVDSPTDVEWKNSQIPLTVDAPGTDMVIEKLSFKSDSKKAIYFKKIKNININNIVAHAKNHGIDVGKNCNGYYSFENIDIQSDNKRAISIIKGADVNITDAVLKSKKASVYFGKNLDGNYYFKDLNITSRNSNGIYIKNGENITLLDSNVSSKKTSVYVKSANGNYRFDNLVLSSDEDNGIHLKNGQNVEVADTKILSQDSAVYLSDDIDGNYTFSNLELNSTQKSGIKITKGEDVTIEGSRIASKEEAIYIKGQDVNGDYLFKNLVLTTHVKNVIRIDKAQTIDMENSCVFKESTESNRYGIDIRSDNSDTWNPVQLKNNCFYGTPIDSLAKAKNENHVQSNYWDGLNGGFYHFHNIIDQSPLNSCPNNCSNQIQFHSVIDYRMDECDWDSDENTYEIKNYGSGGDDYNATAKNDANVTEGKLCNGGDMNSSAQSDKALLPKSLYALPHQYTLNVWIKFPLNADGHKTFRKGGWFSSRQVQYFNIVDRVGSDNDFIYFTRNISNDSWTLNVKDDNQNDSYGFNPQNLTGWHMLTFVVGGGGTDFYLDGEAKHSFSTHPDTGQMGLLFNSDYQSSGDNIPNQQSIGTDVDEFEIYAKTLSADDVQTLYDYENGGNNSDGTPRVCPDCNQPPPPTQNYGFDAWDTFRNIDDRNISTKIVAKAFSLVIASLDENRTNYQEFNGTVCSRIVINNDGNVTDWKQNVFIDQNRSDQTAQGNPDFNVTQAVKKAQVEIIWKKNIAADCITLAQMADHNETNSSDIFAIRPDHFVIDAIGGNIKAGSEFNLTVHAKDADGNDAKDYNETVIISLDASPALEYNESKASTCRKGVLSGQGVFKDGEANITLRYNEVGNLKIRLLEHNGTDFAHVDIDDTDFNTTTHDSGNHDGGSIYREINTTETSVVFIPHHFEVNATLSDFDTDNNFTYLSKDLNMSASFDVTITAKNEQNQTTRNYVNACYAKDVDVRIDHAGVVSSNLSQLLYILNDANDTNHTTVTIGKNDSISLTYDKANFSLANSRVDQNGTTALRIFFNFDRNASKTVDPFELNVTDINVTDGDANGSGYTHIDGNATFYYGRIRVGDVTTKKLSITHHYTIEVYDTNGSDPLIEGMKSAGLYWWLNGKEQDFSDGNVTGYHAKNGYALSGSDDTHLSLSDFSAPAEGKVTFSLDYGTDVDHTVHDVVHLSISPWLWYVPEGLGGDYDFSSGSDCTRHPCFDYTLYGKKATAGVRSGEMNGSDFAIPEGNNTHSGIKLFR